jgi:hypothetical protein
LRAGEVGKGTVARRRRARKQIDAPAPLFKRTSLHRRSSAFIRGFFFLFFAADAKAAAQGGCFDFSRAAAFT